MDNVVCGHSVFQSEETSEWFMSIYVYLQEHLLQANAVVQGMGPVH